MIACMFVILTTISLSGSGKISLKLSLVVFFFFPFRPSFPFSTNGRDGVAGMPVTSARKTAENTAGRDSPSTARPPDEDPRVPTASPLRLAARFARLAFFRRPALVLVGRWCLTDAPDEKRPQAWDYCAGSGSLEMRINADNGITATCIVCDPPMKRIQHSGFLLDHWLFLSPTEAQERIAFQLIGGTVWSNSFLFLPMAHWESSKLVWVGNAGY